VKWNKRFEQDFSLFDGNSGKLDTICPGHVHGINPGQLLQGPLGYPAPLDNVAKRPYSLMQPGNIAFALGTDHPTGLEIKPEL
jgi:hypothetical protein